jgi:hypothetical protein
MLKKLLVAAIALSFIFAVCSSASAAKGPNEVKRLYNTIPNAQRTIPAENYIVPDQPPAGVHSLDQAHLIPGGLTLPSHKVSSCDWYDYSCNVTYYWTIPDDTYPIDLFNMRFSPPDPAAICTLQTLEIAFYQAGSVTNTDAGVTLYVWNDDGFGFPGTVAYSVVVPTASIVWYPSVLDVDVSSEGLIFTSDYHFGYTTNDQTPVTGDVFACLSDDGSCGVQRSSEYDADYGWGLMANDWLLDCNFLMAVEACCGVPGPVDCQWLAYDQAGASYYWTIPDDYDDDFFNERFTPTIPNLLSCVVDSAAMAIYGPGCVIQPGGAGIDIYLWDDDGLGFPGTVLHTVNVPSDDVTDFYPTYLVVSMPSVAVPGDYHVGYTTVDQANEVWACLSDAGENPYLRSSVAVAGAWDFILYVAGIDANFLIQAYNCCEYEPQVQNCYNIDYAGQAWYFWTIPDAYGDDFFNMRFTGDDLCTLMTANFGFYQAASVGNPGAEIYVWNSDGLYPTSVITTFQVNPVTNWFPGYEAVDMSGAGIIFASNLHVGYTPIYNDPSDVLAIASDDGLSGGQRSSENWAGIWGLMIDDWGIDVDFLINLDVCCPPPGYCATICHDDDQWPTFAHDYARTAQTGVSLGDLCGMTCAWNYLGLGDIINNTSLTIADDKVFVAFNSDFVCLDLFNGNRIWGTQGNPAYDLVLVGGCRTIATYEDGYVYFGTGVATKGFVKADAGTGAIQWARGSLIGNPLPGNPGVTSFAPSVILGDEIYFGDDDGQIYALNKNTGADIDFAQLDYGVWTSPAYAAGESNDDPPVSFDYLFFGTADNVDGGAGSIWAITPPNGGTFSTGWQYVSPFAGLLADGWTATPSYRCGRLFIKSSYAYGNYSTYSGLRENLNPATGAEQWADHYLGGATKFGGAATIGNFGGEDPLVFYPNSIVNAAGNAYGRGIRAVNNANATVWINGSVGGYDNNVMSHPTVTCDPLVIYGTWNTSTQGGKLYMVNAYDGSVVLSYDFTGAVNGTAVARGSNGQAYVVTSIKNRNYLADGGAVFAFTDDGIPKPKMVVPEHVVSLEGLQVGQGTVTRTDTDAVVNLGCATLNGTATVASSVPAMNRVVSDVNPQLLKTAQDMAYRMVDTRVEDVMSRHEGLTRNKMLVNAVNSDGVSTLPVRPKAANSSALASSWAQFSNNTDNFAFVIAGGSSQDFEFHLTETTMSILNDNVFYVELMSNDPCYLPEDPSANPQDVIEYHINYEYCPKEEGIMAFGTTGEEYYTNYGLFGDGDVAYDFTLTGSDDFLYEGTVFFMTSMDDCAWNIFSANAPSFGGYLFPFFVDYPTSTCGSCDFGTTLPVLYTDDGGVNYSNPTGDLCSFAVIDSMQAEYSAIWPHQNGPSIGIWVKYREVGTYSVAAFPQFDYFKLVVMDIINRSEEKAPINGLYYGVFTDWDIESGNNLHDGSIENGYVYGWDPAATSVYGHIGLPRKGSYFCDGAKTDPMYNARINYNPDEIYPPADYTPDSLYSWINSNPEGALTFAANAAPSDAADDQSYEIAFGKVDLGATPHSFGFALFGLPNAVGSADYEVNELSKFINKYAGFGRGDVNNDGVIDLKDLVYLSEYTAGVGPGPVPFMHLGDLNCDGNVDALDAQYFGNYFFYYGPPPGGAFMF